MSRLKNSWLASDEMAKQRKQKKPRRRWIPGPDNRNIPRGVAWLSEMISASEAMDQGKKKAMTAALDTMQAPLLKREREPGEDDC